MAAVSVQKDWNPGAYARFRGLRLRPALDLMLAVRSVGGGDVIDLGCGNGAMGQSLRERYPGHRIVGVDASPAMLAKARETGAYHALDESDIADWSEDRAGLIYSNAALHWLAGHEALFPRLAGMLAPGGTLAVQMPHQNNAPSHRVWVSLADELFPGRVDMSTGPGVMKAPRYHHMLAEVGEFSLWETEYYQVLGADKSGHPVRRFTESTFARPILAALEPDEQAELVRRYEEVMETAYPRRDDGTVLFPFRRMFFTLTV
ncbi:methyltransferase domain-containing protein [Marimonas lutisalis]|uniref:methyltransferase domain-containing protein n=1 Tax=Marimonas lutisalis TaxID=2545756 RepID=UPI0010F93EC2|nr:methyltransferase domain-containing protein [Marimonas lutisalis]